MKNSAFDDIRPYYDEEIPGAMQRIVASELFPQLASYVYPGCDITAVREMVKGFRTISDFQFEVMCRVNEQVLSRSITELSYTGVERLNRARHYLFVSNHRDIMLDSCLLQYILYKNGHDTTEITFGANLMSTPLIIDIGKSNKMFKVERGGTMKEFYRSSMHLSEYIRYVITAKGQSVWIAQRNGRTKDGHDTTDQGIIKMFCMSGPADKIEALCSLNIVPVSVSYEWEPCDVLKTQELYESRFTKYRKKPGEDLNSIVTGITRPKGKVHFEIGEQLTQEDLLPFATCTPNEYHKEVALLLDKRICSNYKLTPNNYIAHDLRSGRLAYSNFYTDEQKKEFVNYMTACLNRYETYDPVILKRIFLGIYANPVDNK